MRATELLLLPMLVGLQTTPNITVADNMTIRWNRLVPNLVVEAAASRKAARATATAAHDSAALRRIAQTQPPLLMRVYTLLSVAQYGAVNSVRDAKTASADVATASASAAILNDFFTDSATRATIARELARDMANAGTTSSAAERVATGKRLGEEVARRVIAEGPSFNLVTPWKGTIPTGPGMWYSAPGIPPIGVSLTTAQGWLIDSASEFKPTPPPAFGSPAWKAALEEVQRVSRERTPEQAAIARDWNSSDPWARWNDRAVAEIRRHALSGADAARVMAVLNIAATDASIACFAAKYHYWTIRPSQTDSSLALADSVGLPNFPSYPSGHACSAGAFDAALGHFFPKQRAEFTRVAEEQAMSRLYGGVHYRFDNDEGLALGRMVARNAVDREKHGRLNVWRVSTPDRKP